MFLGQHSVNFRKWSLSVVDRVQPHASLFSVTLSSLWLLLLGMSFRGLSWRYLRVNPGVQLHWTTWRKRGGCRGGSEDERVSATARSDCHTGVEEWSLWSDENRFQVSPYHWKLQDLGQIASPTWNSVPHSIPHPSSGLPWKQNSIWTWVAQLTLGFALRKGGRLSGRVWFWWESEVELSKWSKNSYRIVRREAGSFVVVFNVNCLYSCSSSKWGSIQKMCGVYLLNSTYPSFSKSWPNIIRIFQRDKAMTKS